jgi:hypothetical protein
MRRAISTISFTLIIFFTACEKNSTNEVHCSVNVIPEYYLPFPIGETYLCIQGYCGSFSHMNEWRYAIDFKMPIGTVVTASRRGIVNNLREGIADGDTTESNFVLILHEDSTASRYLHLTQNGVLVQIGDTVEIGDTIALSGNTGFSSQPHLHFDVIGYCTSAPCQTQPISFINSDDAIPIEGISYTAR